MDWLVMQLENNRAGKRAVPKTRPYRPRNLTALCVFDDNWCSQCRHDTVGRVDEAGVRVPGCEIQARVIFTIDDPRYPTEWIEDDVKRRTPSHPRCTVFQPKTTPSRKGKIT